MGELLKGGAGEQCGGEGRGQAGMCGDTRLEASCARAIAVGDPSYRTIKGILIAGTETDSEPETSRDAGAAAFLHCPARLFATVATPDATDAVHDDQVHDEAEVEAR